MGGMGVRLKLDVQGKGGGFWQGEWGSRNMDNFHGRHMCIIPNISARINICAFDKNINNNSLHKLQLNRSWFVIHDGVFNFHDNLKNQKKGINGMIDGFVTFK